MIWDNKKPDGLSKMLLTNKDKQGCSKCKQTICERCNKCTYHCKCQLPVKTPVPKQSANSKASDTLSSHLLVKNQYDSGWDVSGNEPNGDEAPSPGILVPLILYLNWNVLLTKKLARKICFQPKTSTHSWRHLISATISLRICLVSRLGVAQMWNSSYLMTNMASRRLQQWSMSLSI
jgi:hypothetical protein